MIRSARAPALLRAMTCVASLAIWPLAAQAARFCSFSSAVPVSFGIYDVYAAAANNAGVGSITINCSGGGGPFNVALSTGQSLTYAMRVMNSGANKLNYNLYTSAGRSVVWGDGSGVSQVMTVARNTQTRLDIFGQIPPLQDVAVGSYSDIIIATVNF